MGSAVRRYVWTLGLTTAALAPCVLPTIAAAAVTSARGSATLTLATAARRVQDSDAQRRQELHNKGQSRFDAGDYEGALELWIQAHEQLPPDPELEAYRALLLHAIATAALRASEASDSSEPLRRAHAVYERDLDPTRSAADGGIEDEEQLRGLVEQRRALERALAEREQVESTPEGPPTATGDPDARRERPSPWVSRRPGEKPRRNFMHAAPGVLAVNVENADWFGYQYGFGGGRLWEHRGGFALALSGAFEHWLHIGETFKAHVISIGPELRLGASTANWFAYGMTGLNLNIYSVKLMPVGFPQSSNTSAGVGFPLIAGFWWFLTPGFYVGTEVGPDLDLRWIEDMLGEKERTLLIAFQWKILLGGRF